jgi:hypothetical protein
MTIRNRAKVLIGIGLLIGVFAGSAYGGIYFMTGNDLAKRMRAYDAQRFQTVEEKLRAAFYFGFVIGVFDSNSMNFNANIKIKPHQIGVIVSKYLKEHPERWHEPAYLIVIDALKQAFPK